MEPKVRYVSYVPVPVATTSNSTTTSTDCER
jgi:hypothetical protein